MQQSEIVLAIDAGSTWCKAAYVTLSGEFIAMGRSYRRGGPPYGHDLSDLEYIWNGIRAAVHEATTKLPLDMSPAAVSIACRKAPGIWLDSKGLPIEVPRASILAAGRDVIESCYRPELWSPPGPFAYGYGLDLIGNTRWIRLEHSDLWSRVRFVGTLHSWLMKQLTGRWLTSPAAGPAQLAWPDEVTALTGFAPGAFPEVEPEHRVAGELKADAAGDLGLPPGIPIVTGTHDGAAANIGAGAISRGDACLTLGTNGVLRAVTGERLPLTFGYTITGDRWALVRDIVGLAPFLDTVVHTIDGSTGAVAPERHRSLEREVADVPIGANGLLLPVEVNLETLRDTVQRALRTGHDAATVYRAALEGIAMAFLGLVKHARARGAAPTRYSATGGATRSEVLMELISAAIGEPIRISHPEAGLLGVAALACTGAGFHPSVDDAVRQMVRYTRNVAASQAMEDAYAELAQHSIIPEGVAPGDSISRPGAS